MNQFLTVAIGFLGLMQQTNYVKIITEMAQPIKEKVAFTYYRFHNGFKEILSQFKINLLEFLYPKKPPKQYDLFSNAKFKDRYKNFTKFA